MPVPPPYTREEEDGPLPGPGAPERLSPASQEEVVPLTTEPNIPHGTHEKQNLQGLWKLTRARPRN